MTPQLRAHDDERKRGRRRKNGTTVTSVRIDNAVLDAYCKLAVRSGLDVRTVLRHVLAKHAPSGR